MKKVSLIQNTAEWHSWRSQGIGASDVPALVGANPFQTRQQFVYEFRSRARNVERRGTFGSSNKDVQRGVRLESEARRMLEQSLDLTFDPQCGEWEEDNFLRASLDGHHPGENLICEIKAPRGFRAISDCYFYQIQAQLLVSGAKECIFCQIVEVSGRPKIKWEIVKPDATAEQKIRAAIKALKDELEAV